MEELIIARLTSTFIILFPDHDPGVLEVDGGRYILYSKHDDDYMLIWVDDWLIGYSDGEVILTCRTNILKSIAKIWK